MTAIMVSHGVVSRPKSSVLGLFILSTPRTPATTDCFAISVVFPFLEAHVVGIVQSEALSEWLPSLRDMH